MNVNLSWTKGADSFSRYDENKFIFVNTATKRVLTTLHPALLEKHFIRSTVCIIIGLLLAGLVHQPQ